MTSAAAATSDGTIAASGVKNIAAKNNPPVTRLARPVRAPSPMPAPDSMNTVFDDADTAPPTTAPAPSTTSADCSRGKLPCSSASPAWRDRPVKRAHRVEEVGEHQREHQHDRGQDADAPEAVEAELRRPATGRARANGEPDSVGTDRLQPPGFLVAGPRCQMASTTTATTVPATSPIRMPPRTFRATRMPVTSSVNTKMTVGTVLIEPRAVGAETDRRRRRLRWRRRTRRRPAR